MEKTTKYLFLLVAFFGIFHALLMPPFQSPDEPMHYLRIYHISGGKCKGEVAADKKNMGGYLPAKIHDVYAPYNHLPFHLSQKIDFDTLKNNLFKRYNFDSIAFSAMPNTARYAFSAYAPQAAVMFLMEKCHAPQLLTLYLMRFVMLFLWLTLLFFAIKVAPIYQNLLLFFAVLPTSLAINSTISADVLSNSFSFLILAYFLKFRFTQNIITKKDLLIFSFFILLLSWQKIVYFPLLFLLWLVPSPNFGNLKNKIIVFVTLLLLVLSVVFWWANEVNQLIYPTANKYFTTYTALRPCEGENTVNPILQMEVIKNEPLIAIKNLLHVSFKAYGGAFGSYISTSSWDDIQLPEFLLLLSKIFFILIVLSQTNIFSIWERIYLFLLGHGLILIFSLSQHLHWDCVGEGFSLISNGKYYIPIYPILAFSLVGLGQKKYEKLKHKNLIFNILLLFGVVLQVIFLIMIVKRFYF
jgi:uncharacterized membrane protein